MIISKEAIFDAPGPQIVVSDREPTLREVLRAYYEGACWDPSLVGGLVQAYVDKWEPKE